VHSDMCCHRSLKTVVLGMENMRKSRIMKKQHKLKINEKPFRIYAVQNVLKIIK